MREPDARIPRTGLIDALSVGTLGLRTRRLRGALAGLGIAVAVATVIVVTSIPASSHAALDQRLAALGPGLLRADPLPGDAAVTLPPTAVGMLDRIGPVLSAAAVGNTHSAVRRNDRLPEADSGLTTLAATSGLLATVRGDLAWGRWVAPGVLPTVVLGAAAAQRLGFEGRPDGRVTIQVGGTRFEVRGVLRPVRLSADLDSTVLVSAQAARRWLGWGGGYTVAYAQVDEASVEEVRHVIAATLSPRASGLVTVSRPSAVLAAKKETGRAFDGLVVGLAGVALLVGGIGVADTMFVSVLERRREIGLRRALGAHRGQIRSQFLIEAVSLCLLGGSAGVGLGAAASAVWALVHGWPLVVSVPTIAVCFGASVLIGVLAGLAPSIRAARMSPTSALAAD